MSLARRLAIAALGWGGGCDEATGDDASPSPVVSDAVADAPPPAQWRPVAGVPAACGGRVAVTANDVPGLVRRSCTSGRAGCERHELEPDARWIRFALHEPIFADDRGVHVSYLRAASADVPDHASLSIVQRLDGDARVEVAFGSPRDGCALVAHGSRDGLALRAVVSTAAGTTHHLAASTWDTPTALVARAAHPGDDAPLSQHAAMSRDVIAVEAMHMSGNVRAAAFRIADASFVAADEALARLQGALPRDGGIVGLDDAQAAIVDVAIDGTVRTLVDRDDGARILGFAMDRADDDALVWIEQAEAGASEASLWTQRGEGTSPRRTGPAPARALVVANDGWAAVVASPDVVRVVRLADGHTRDVVREPDAAWVYAMAVDREAVWLATSAALPGAPGFPTVTGLVRVDHDASSATPRVRDDAASPYP